MSRFADRNVLVTGAASGIGAGVARMFAESGANVLIADLDDDAGTELARKLGPRARFQHLDVACAEDWRNALAIVTAHSGAPDILVNNAAISIPGSIATAKVEDWCRTLDVNGTGTFLGCKYAVDAMRESGGAIVNIASARGRRISAAQLAYSCSKALVISLTQGVALHCAEQRLAIRCNAVCPGVVDTPILAPFYDALGGRARALEHFARFNAVGRLGTVGEIVAAVAFLASSEASFITGAVLDVDGGFRDQGQNRRREIWGGSNIRWHSSPARPGASDRRKHSSSPRKARASCWRTSTAACATSRPSSTTPPPSSWMSPTRRLGRRPSLFLCSASGVSISWSTTPASSGRAPSPICRREAFLEIVRVNQLGTFLGMQAVAGVMARGGSIVNTSSVAGLFGTPGGSAYAASKWAIRGLSRSAAMELAGLGIRVNSLHPGGIDTPMLNGQSAGADLAGIFATYPIPRVGRPEEIARAALFLASDESSYMTGTELVVDGGLQAGPLFLSR